MSRTIVLALTLSMVAASCATPAPKSEAERTVTDPARGVRYVVPEGWSTYDAEIRSHGGTLLTLRVYDLAEAEKKFVAGLPGTLTPQLLGWAKYYYLVEGPAVQTATTVAGVPATEYVYPIRVQPREPPSKVIYWVVTRKSRLFVLRAAFPAETLAAEEPVVRKIVAGWAFLPAPGEPAN
jgi:hypothetical protein